MDVASGVPWIPTPGAERPIQRVPSGLPGPGGIGLRPRAHSESGGRHHGFICMSTIRNVPVGVGYCDWPVATRKLRTSDSPLKSRRLLAPRLMTMTGPKPLFSTEGFSVFITTWSSGRIRVRSVRTIARTIVWRRTVRPHWESAIFGWPLTRPTTTAFSAGIPKRWSSEATYSFTLSRSTSTLTPTSSPLPASRARDTASETSALIPSAAGETAQCWRANVKRTGAEKRAPICWLACPASSPETLTPAIRTPFGIRFDGPAEGAIAIAALSTSRSTSTARFQSDMRTNEAASRFTSKMLRPNLGICREESGRGRDRRGLNLPRAPVEPLGELDERELDERAEQADAPLRGSQRLGVEDALERRERRDQERQHQRRRMRPGAAASKPRPIASRTSIAKLTQRICSGVSGMPPATSTIPAPTKRRMNARA